MEKGIDLISSRKVLVVDDNDVSRRIIKFYLQVCDCEIIEAADGETAIRLAEEHHPQLILMDLMMPEMDGLTATRRIREIEGRSEIPIIFLSANNSVDLKQRAINEGATDYLVKPDDVHRIKSVINKYLSPAR